MSGVIGSTTCNLYAVNSGSSSETSPPLKGWRYYGSKMEPEMECGKPSLPCMAVNVELSGKSLCLHKIKKIHFDVTLLKVRQTIPGEIVLADMSSLMDGGTGAGR